MNIIKNNEFTEKYPCVLYFTAEWCGPCKKIAPVFERLATSNSGIHFYKIDVDENEKLAVTYNVSSMPTFIFFKKESCFERFSGSDEKKLINNVNMLKNNNA